MPLPPPPFPLPDASVLDAAGNRTTTRARFGGAKSLVILGHKDCKTTRQTLPYVDRIHRSGGRAFAVLQDPVGAAAAALRKIDAALPFVCEEDPYPLAQALGVEIVPTLLFVEEDGTVTATSEAFRKADIEAFAARLGVPSPTPAGDPMPATKPG